MAGIILTLWLQTLEICNFSKRLWLLLKHLIPTHKSDSVWTLRCSSDSNVTGVKVPISFGPLLWDLLPQAMNSLPALVLLLWRHFDAKAQAWFWDCTPSGHYCSQHVDTTSECCTQAALARSVNWHVCSDGKGPDIHPSSISRRQSTRSCQAALMCLIRVASHRAQLAIDTSASTTIGRFCWCPVRF